MAKFDVQGRDAGRVLDRISANRVNGKQAGSPTPSGSTQGARWKPTSP